MYLSQPIMAAGGTFHTGYLRLRRVKRWKTKSIASASRAVGRAEIQTEFTPKSASTAAEQR